MSVELKLEQFGLVEAHQVATRLGRNIRTIQRWIDQGLLDAVAIGDERVTYLIPLAALEKFQLPAVGRPKASA